MNNECLKYTTENHSSWNESALDVRDAIIRLNLCLF